jgi:hypothetical protein
LRSAGRDLNCSQILRRYHGSNSAQNVGNLPNVLGNQRRFLRSPFQNFVNVSERFPKSLPRQLLQR